jgi:transcription antitermination factor NusG
MKKTDSTYKDWIVVYTKSRAERKVYDRLIEAGFDCYLPLRKEVRIYSDRKKKVETPLINSVLFVKNNFKSNIPILKTEGVVRILNYLRKPALVKEAEINILKNIIDNKFELDFFNQEDYESGDIVEIISGPFKGLFAETISYKGKFRLIIEIESLSSKFIAHIPISNIIKRENKAS